MKAVTAPTILVIVGITGDLASRKLLPALRKINAAGVLPEKFRVVGITRRDLSPAELFKGGADPLKDRFESFKMDLAAKDAYAGLAARLMRIEKDWEMPAERLFYLSIPPHAVRPVVEHLGAAGLNVRGKLLLEKPFGTDLASAKELIAGIDKYFNEDKVYRIDHYLAKEMTQNLVVFRDSNSLFKQTWNNKFIERINIIASEKIGIEGRAAFYEQTGALRDLVQSHLLQLTALVTMRLPEGGTWDIPAARYAALSKLKIKTGAAGLFAERGQYRGYRDEVNNQKSTVETFVSITLTSADPFWRNVPIRIITGKALDKKSTEIQIFYRKTDSRESNGLTLRVQPDEGVGVCLWTKRPGYDNELEQHPLNFSYSQHYAELPEAYERVLLDAMRSDHSLFASGREVLASWKILEPLRAHWESGSGDLLIYEPGTNPEKIAGQA